MKEFPVLCAICDADACARAGWTVVDFAAACLDGGARFLQVRAKSASSQALLEMSAAVVERASGSGALVIVNDRADVAKASGAGGVHVGQDDLGAALVREIVGTEACVGLSAHTRAQVVQALSQPIDYFAIGPVFDTATKVTGMSPVGLSGVSGAASLALPNEMPLVAIGGITLDRATDVLAAGAWAVAVISDLFITGDPEARVREYLDRFDLN